MTKSRTGIEGLDEVTGGGLPYGRPTLVCGGPGCGKSTLSMEYLIQGALKFDEPGLFFSFEQSEHELIQDFSSLHEMLPDLIQQGKLYMEYINAGPAEQSQVGKFSLDALFMRIEAALSKVKGKRVVLDPIDALFEAFPDKTFMRNELNRLFNWFKEREITAVITGEEGKRSLTRWGLEEYITDCVISIDHRIVEQTSTRRLRIIKYRGSAHGTNEYPFLINEDGVSVVYPFLLSEDGVSVIPVTSFGLDYSVSSEGVSSGIPDLDEMLLGKNGYYRGSSVLISGQAGCGKSSVAAAFAASVCASGESCLYFAFEESPQQILRNMASIGIELQEWLDRGLLSFKAQQLTMTGLEFKLHMMISMVNKLAPAAVVIDPIANLLNVGSFREVKSMLIRFMDILKKRHITILMTHLTSGSEDLMETQTGISSIMDTWISLSRKSSGSSNNRLIEIIKSRGMKHREEQRAFILHDGGISIRREGELSHD